MVESISTWSIVRRRAIWLIVAVTPCVTLAACGESSDAESETIRIGVLAELSGPFVGYGEPMNDGIAMAADEINSDGGLTVGDKTYQVELVVRDTRSDVNTAVAATTELVRDEEVDFIFGPAVGSETVAAISKTQPAGVIHLSVSSALDGVLTEDNAKEDGDMSHLVMLQTGARDREPVLIAGTSEYLDDPVNNDIIISNDANGEFLSGTVTTAIEDAGGNVVQTVFYEPGTTDFATYLTKVRDDGVDALHVWYNPADSINILAQAVDLGAAPSYFAFGVEPGDLVDRLGNRADNIVVACSPLCRSEVTSPESETFWSAFDEFVGAKDREVGASAGIAVSMYDGLHMLLEAISSAGTVSDTDAIMSALKDVTYEGVLGSLSLNERNQLKHGIDMCLLRDGKPECEFVGG